MRSGSAYFTGGLVEQNLLVFTGARSPARHFRYGAHPEPPPSPLLPLLSLPAGGDHLFQHQVNASPPSSEVLDFARRNFTLHQGSSVQGLHGGQVRQKGVFLFTIESLATDSDAGPGSAFFFGYTGGNSMPAQQSGPWRFLRAQQLAPVSYRFLTAALADGRPALKVGCSAGGS